MLDFYTEHLWLGLCTEVFADLGVHTAVWEAGKLLEVCSGTILFMQRKNPSHPKEQAPVSGSELSPPQVLQFPWYRKRATGNLDPVLREAAMGLRGPCSVLWEVSEGEGGWPSPASIHYLQIFSFTF